MLCVEVFGIMVKVSASRPATFVERGIGLRSLRLRRSKRRRIWCSTFLNEFVRRVFAYVVAQVPSCKISFEKPEDGYCFDISYNSRRGMSVQYGIAWGDIKNSMEADLWLMNQVLLIEDDTICDDDNAALFIEKICDYLEDQAFSRSFE